MEHEKKPKVLFVLGGPGSGKGTQCELMTEQFKFEHLSTGDLLREEVKAGTELGQEIESYISKGNMVPGDIAVKLIRKAMEKKGWGKVYLIDGYPRNFSNIEKWEEVIKNDVEIAGILYLTCSEETMTKRALKRAETSGRSDDNEEIFKKRLVVFKNETEPVVSHYKKQGKLYEISAEGTKEQCFEQARKIIESLNLDKYARTEELKDYLKSNVDVYLKPLIVHLMKTRPEKVHGAIKEWLDEEGEGIRKNVETDDSKNDRELI